MKIYLAGPDVFRPDAQDWVETARALCRRHGFEPLTPLDHEVSDPGAIFRGNLDLIRAAQAVVANLNPFRGAEPDSGTCFEIGYACALGKPVHGYLDRHEPLLERVRRAGLAGSDGKRDLQGLLIEDFGLPLNLMLAMPVRIIEGDLAHCLASLAVAPLAALPDDPRIRALQEAAIRYLRWVEAGRIEDGDPRGTIAGHYGIGAEVLGKWIEAWSAVSLASTTDYRPDDIVRQMKVGGRQFRAHVRPAA